MKIFITHSEKDIELARKLKESLKDDCEIYIAADDIQPGRSLPDKIVTNIKSSNYLIGLITRDAVSSQWVQQEIGIAKANNIPIIPLVEPGVKIKGVLEGIEYITLDRNNPYKTLNNLREYIHRKKKQKQTDEIIIIALALISLIILASYKE